MKMKIVFAALSDKNVADMAAAMGPLTDVWYLAGLALERGLSAADLRERMGLSGGTAMVRVSVDVRSALQLARSEASEFDRIVVCGSFHTVAVALAVLG